MKVFMERDESLASDLQLWRYMDVAKFVSMLQKQAIWLARADTFKDKHEGRIPNEMFAFIRKAYDDLSNDDSSPVTGPEDFQDYLIKNTFVSCWHRNADENMVMWELYGQDSNAVAIQTTVNRIEESLNTSALSGHSLLFRPVTYANAEEVKGILLYEECVFRKRRHFQFEQEVRICLDTYSRKDPRKDTPFGYEVPVFISGLIEKIIVHPDSAPWFLAAIESVACKYGVHAPVVRGAYGNS